MRAAALAILVGLAAGAPFPAEAETGGWFIFNTSKHVCEKNGQPQYKSPAAFEAWARKLDAPVTPAIIERDANGKPSFVEVTGVAGGTLIDVSFFRTAALCEEVFRKIYGKPGELE